MAYEVTAARKRPSTFNTLAGQEFAAASLSKSVLNGKIAHAYLFSGPRGVGKTSAARILAKAVNCEKGPAENPCNKCESCNAITRGNSMDVIEIDGASNTSVNDVREIKDEVLFAPNSSRYKVYIIDEVHMLSNSAFNALLKTIEEPPPYILFIFATTEIHKVPATIKSRCQQFSFRLLDIDIIKAKLEEAADESGIEAEDEALFWIAREATGSLRDAYTLFDQAAAFSDNVVTLQKLKDKLGLAGLDEINELALLAAPGKTGEALVKTSEILGRGISADQFVVELAQYFRNILLIKSGVVKEGILGFPAGRFSEEVINSFSLQQVECALSMILDLYRELRYSLNPSFEIELLVSRLSCLHRYLTEDEILEKVASLKDEVKKISRETVPRESASGGGGQQPEEPVENFTRYRDILSGSVKKHNMLLASSIAKTSLWEKRGDKVVIHCDDRFSADSINKGLSEVKAALDAEAGGNFKIEILITDRDREEPAKPDSMQVDMVRRVFKGEVVQKRSVKEEADEY